MPASCADGHAEPAAKKQRTSAATARPLPTAIVLDIEGTVAPISFVTEVLFPYAARWLVAHLENTYGSEETQQDIQLLRQLVRAVVLSLIWSWS